MTLHQKYGILLSLVLLVLSLPLAYTAFSWQKAVEERDYLQKKLDRFEARYELGDLEHTIQFEHTCGHKELFSMNKDQIYYLMELQANPCTDCYRRDNPKPPLDPNKSTQPGEPL
jgi:hypothetical protein